VTLESLPNKKRLLIERFNKVDGEFSRVAYYIKHHDSKLPSLEKKRTEAQEQLVNVEESLEFLKEALIKARSVRGEYRKIEGGLSEKISPYNVAVDDIEYAASGVSEEGQSVDALKKVYLEKLKSLHRKESGKVADYRTTLETHQDYLDAHQEDFKQYADIDEVQIRAVDLDDIDFTINKIKKRLSVNDDTVGERYKKIEDAKTTLSIQQNLWINVSIVPSEPVIPDDIETKEADALIKAAKEESEELEARIKTNETKVLDIGNIEEEILKDSRIYTQV